jgi:glutamyl-tRNA synthetase
VLRAAAVFRDRCSTGAELADWLAIVFADVAPSPEDLAQHVTDAVRPAIATLRDKLAGAPWDKASIAAAIKETLAMHGLKMPQLAPAVRVLVCGRAQTPSLDAVLEVFDRATVLARLRG